MLYVADVEPPDPSKAHVRVRVVTAGLNPGEIAIREGAFEDRVPATFPSGQGTDFAGIVDQNGPGANRFGVDVAVIGWSNERSAQAEFVTVPESQLVAKPDGLSWDAAGGLFVAATTAWAAVAAVDPGIGDTVLVSGAGGAVGSIVAQLVTRRGAEVISVAGSGHHAWLRSIETIPLAYGEGLMAAIRDEARSGVDAVIDCSGGGYVENGIELGVSPRRINTTIDFDAAKRHDGVRIDGSAQAEDPEVLADIAQLVASGDLAIRVPARYELDDVVAAYERLAQGHTGGKFVFQVSAP